MEVNKRIFHLLDIQNKTASQLSKYIEISNASVSGWKNSGSYPSSKYLKGISEFLNVTPDYLVLGTDNLPPTLRGDEKNILRLYNRLDDSGRRLHIVNLFKEVKTNEEDRKWFAENKEEIDKLLSDQFNSRTTTIVNQEEQTTPYLFDDDTDVLADFFDNDKHSYPIPREITVYEQPSSAGTGTFLDSDDYDVIEFPFDQVPLKTTFGVKVTGDSMEPDFYDDDIVFVRQQPNLENGEIGIFMLNGDSYIKELSKNKKHIELISLNSKYKPIRIAKHDELRTIGKVIGKFSST